MSTQTDMPARKPVAHVRNDSADGWRIEMAQNAMAAWGGRGYTVTPVPADGQEHPFGKRCLACSPMPERSPAEQIEEKS